MLVQTPSPTASPSLPTSRRNRKRKARGESHGSRERAKTPRRQPPPVRPIAKPEPDEDSGLGFDESSQGGCESARLLTTSHPSLVTNVRVTPQEEDASDGFVSDRHTTAQHPAQPPFLKGIRPVSRCGRYRLELIREPESRHRARYQTEGSRGAVKDSTGKSSPQVVLRGYTRPCQLQMYVGSDADGCSPHLFYQACRVTGKTASASRELTLDGTVVIETEMLPEPSGAAASARCDCLGILKQRNVDIETRVAAAGGGGSGASGRRAVPLRKGPRTTSCRLVFRVTIVNDLGETETLQIASRSVVCTQPQGVPEVTKLSLKEAPCTGGAELILLGKNFVKDSCVVLAEAEEEGGGAGWSEVVPPQKEHHQSVHLVCRVPAYWDQTLTVPRAVSVTVRSGDKESDPVPFTYLPAAPCRGPPRAAVTCPSEHRDAPAAPAAATATAATAAGRLINGVSQAAIAINRHFAETGEIRLEAAQAGQPRRRTPEPAPAPAAAGGATQAGQVSIRNEEASAAASHAVFMVPTSQKAIVFADAGSTQVQEAQPMITGELNTLQHPAAQNLEQPQQMEEEDLKPSRRLSAESLHITQHLAVRNLQQADQILAVDSRSAVMQLSPASEEVHSTETLLSPSLRSQQQAQTVQDVGGHAATSASPLAEYQQRPQSVADQPPALHADSGACWSSADPEPKWSQAGVSAGPQTQSWTTPAPSAEGQCDWTSQSEPSTLVGKKDWVKTLATEPAPASQPWVETVESTQTAAESQSPAQNQLQWSQPKPVTSMEWAPTADSSAETAAWAGRSPEADASTVQVWSVDSSGVTSHPQVAALATGATPAAGQTPAADLHTEPVPTPSPHGWTAADPLPPTSAGWSLSAEPASLAASVWPATSAATTPAPSGASEVKPAAVWVAVPTVSEDGAAVPLAANWSSQVTSEPAAGSPPAWKPAAQEPTPALHTWTDQQAVATPSQAGPVENAPAWQQQQQLPPAETTAAAAPVPGAEQWQHQLKPDETETWAGAEVHSWSAEQLADVLGDPLPEPKQPAEQQQQQLVDWTANTVAPHPPPVEPQQEPAGWVVVHAQHPQQQQQDTHPTESGWTVTEPQQPQQQQEQHLAEGSWTVAEPQPQPQQRQDTHLVEGSWTVAEPQSQQPQQQQEQHLAEGSWTVAEPQSQQPQQQQQEQHLAEGSWAVAEPQPQQPQQQQDTHLAEGSWAVGDQKQEVALAGNQRQLVQSRWEVALPESERQQQPQQGWTGGQSAAAAEAASPGDPMWGEPAFGSDPAPAEDPLADMPTGMGLIEYINGDHE